MKDYDELIDHPVEMGRFVEYQFDVAGIQHRLAVTGHVSADLDRFTRDLTNICAEHIALFQEPPPMPQYLFMLMVLNEGYGGLEHRNSTSLICQRDDLPQPKQKKPSTTYKKLMGLCSHEYFHSWNVKRIKPAAFTPFDLSKEAYTTLLWWFEGITSYYDDLALRRCEIYSLQSYLEILGHTITRVYRPAGRLKQTLAESSFDAWTKFYKQNENSPNDIISYYAKGAVVGLCLDLLIRLKSEGQYSLDDIMRAMWIRFGKTGVGVPEDAIPGLVTEVTGLDLSDFFQRALHEHGDLPVPELLHEFGIRVVFRPAESPTDKGGSIPKLDRRTLMNTPVLGAVTTQSGGGAKIKTAFEGGAAQQCGLSAGDIIIAIDGLQVNHASLHKRLGERYIGTSVTVHAFRRDTLMQFEMTLLEPPCEFVHLEQDPDATDEAIARRKAWLRSNQVRW